MTRCFTSNQNRRLKNLIRKFCPTFSKKYPFLFEKKGSGEMLYCVRLLLYLKKFDFQSIEKVKTLCQKKFSQQEKYQEKQRNTHSSNYYAEKIRYENLFRNLCNLILTQELFDQRKIYELFQTYDKQRKKQGQSGRKFLENQIQKIKKEFKQDDKSQPNHQKIDEQKRQVTIEENQLNSQVQNQLISESSNYFMNSIPLDSNIRQESEEQNDIFSVLINQEEQILQLEQWESFL